MTFLACVSGVCGCETRKLKMYRFAMVAALLTLGQHNFEFRSASRFHGKCGAAGLISNSHLTRIFEGISVEKLKLKMRQFSFHI